MQVLVIDDDKDILNSISAILKKKGFDPVSTDNVKDAQELIRSKKWDLIITDIMIPHLGGFELVSLIKKESPNTPVIVVTGMSKEILDATVIEANAVLTKPFTSKELADAVLSFTSGK